jgi:pimeloyl-ACP methyl ester carboxylesterase
MSDPDPTVVMTLVHGTFAPRAAWTRADSAMAKALVREFGPRTLIRSFDWGGRNSHDARRAGGLNLARQLEEELSRYPSARHFVIAHSHGGNVALYALKSPAVERGLTGMVTIGTPFIRCSPREITRALKVMSVATPHVILMTMLPLSVTVLLTIFDLRPSIWTFLLAFIGTILAARAGRALAERAAAFLKYEAKYRILDSQVDTITALRLPDSSRVPLLCLVASGDEARFYLRLLHRLSEVPYTLWSLSTAIVAYAACSIGLVFLVTIGNDPLGMIDEQGAVGRPIDIIFMALLFPFVILAFVAVLTQVVMAVTPKFVRAHSAGFGRESIFANWFVSISVSERPDGHWLNCRLLANLPVRTGGLLRHSRLYGDESSIRLLTQWLSGTAPRWGTTAEAN